MWIILKTDYSYHTPPPMFSLETRKEYLIKFFTRRLIVYAAYRKSGYK